MAIDGPAGAGKSSVSKAVASALGFVLVDTGAIYRALGLVASERGLDLHEEEALCGLLEQMAIDFVMVEGKPHIRVNGVDRAGEIRTPAVSEAASHVSAHPRVREALLGLQRALASEGGVVMEGRDIGTVVCPGAEVKVFLTASAEERTRRRAAELQARGEEVDEAALFEQIVARDRRDEERATAPLKPADDATILDSTSLSLAEVVERIVQLAS